MDEQPRTPFSPQIKVLAGTAFATALVVSLGWAIAWRDLNRLHRADFEQFERRINQLDSQLDDQLETMRELLKEYAGSQDARIALESRLAAAETQLERARADVETYESGDWESRFRNEQQRADDLSRAAADLEQQLAERARLGLPPATEMLALEIRGAGEVKPFDDELRALDPPALLGPAQSAQGWRWLLQGTLRPLKPELRPLVQKWRETGATVRIDADPIDL